MTTDRPKVMYRGVSMIEGWPEKIQAAQAILTCEINGTEVPRVRYGEEEDDWGANTRPCHDCGVLKGELHAEGCDVERCWMWWTAIHCDCEGSGEIDGE